MTEIVKTDQRYAPASGIVEWCSPVQSQEYLYLGAIWSPGTQVQRWKIEGTLNEGSATFDALCRRQKKHVILTATTGRSRLQDYRIDRFDH